jgi:hypothetical protein
MRNCFDERGFFVCIHPMETGLKEVKLSKLPFISLSLGFKKFGSEDDRAVFELLEVYDARISGKGAHSKEILKLSVAGEIWRP